MAVVVILLRLMPWQVILCQAGPLVTSHRQTNR